MPNTDVSMLWDKVAKPDVIVINHKFMIHNQDRQLMYVVPGRDGLMAVRYGTVSFYLTAPDYHIKSKEHVIIPDESPIIVRYTTLNIMYCRISCIMRYADAKVRVTDMVGIKQTDYCDVCMLLGYEDIHKGAKGGSGGGRRGYNLRAQKVMGVAKQYIITFDKTTDAASIQFMFILYSLAPTSNHAWWLIHFIASNRNAHMQSCSLHTCGSVAYC